MTTSKFRTNDNMLIRTMQRPNFKPLEIRPHSHNRIQQYLKLKKVNFPSGIAP